MHKVVLVTPAKMSLRELSEKLTAAREASAASSEAAGSKAPDREDQAELGLDFPEHHLWIEMPEGIPSCLAIAPNRKPSVSECG